MTNTPPLPADALAILTHPESVACHPALMQHAWMQAKAARGQVVHLHRLAVTAHLMSAPTAPPAPRGTVEAIDAIRHRVGPAIRQRIAARLAAQAAARQDMQGGGDAA